eukprot:c3910_g1_i2.p1 GENE.c3910_g1_i2~~c3910_g1_i2.p1  ORF type:complete len:201 (+),score=17.60 c3910_g1_i2:45-647(+)
MSGTSIARAKQFGAFMARVAMSSVRSQDNKKTIFDHQRIPDISIFDYAQRIGRFMKCSDESFLIATAYILKLRNQSLFRDIVCTSTAHRMMIASITVATKFLDESTMSNLYYAAVGGVRLEELNMLELEMLRRLGWNAFVKPSQYDEANQALVPLSHPIIDNRLWWSVLYSYNLIHINPNILPIAYNTADENDSDVQDYF